MKLRLLLSVETRMHLDALLTVTNTEAEEQKETSATAQESHWGEEKEGTVLPHPQSALRFLKHDADLFAHVSIKTLDGYRSRF